MTSSVWDTSSNGGCRIDCINTAQFLAFCHTLGPRCWFLCSHVSRGRVSKALMTHLVTLLIAQSVACRLLTSHFQIEPYSLELRCKKVLKKVLGTKYYHLMENPKKRVQLSWAGTSGKKKTMRNSVVALTSTWKSNGGAISSFILLSWLLPRSWISLASEQKTSLSF